MRTDLGLDAQTAFEVTQTVNEHYRFLDDGDYDAVVAQTAPGASIERGPGEYVTGPEGMRASMNSRNPMRSTSHIPMAPIVEPAGDGRVRVTYTITAWVRPRQPEGAASFDVDPSCLLGIVKAVDHLVMVDGTWKFEHRRYSAALS